MEIKNAIIKSTFLGFEDHGFFTFILDLDYGGSGQGVGLFCLDHKEWDRNEGQKDDAQLAKSFRLIEKILNVIGVDSWEELPGKHIKVKAEHTKVHEISHILKENWLNFEKFLNPEK